MIEIPKPEKFDGDANEWIAQVVIKQLITEYPGPGRYQKYRIDFSGCIYITSIIEHITKMLLDAGWIPSWRSGDEWDIHNLTITHPWEAGDAK